MASVATPWYLTPPALAIIADLRADPPKQEWREATYVLTRDEWTVFIGPLVEKLEAVSAEAFRDAEARGEDVSPICRTSPSRVIEAATGNRLHPCYLYDIARIDALAAEIDAALVAGERRAA